MSAQRVYRSGCSILISYHPRTQPLNPRRRRPAWSDVCALTTVSESTWCETMWMMMIMMIRRFTVAIMTAIRRLPRCQDTPLATSSSTDATPVTWTFWYAVITIPVSYRIVTYLFGVNWHITYIKAKEHHKARLYQANVHPFKGLFPG